jgi:hypothetical protein
VSIEDEARTETVEALDRLTQIALDNTSEDVHDAVYEDAKRVRAEWAASRKVEVAPSDTDRQLLINVMRQARNPGGEVVLRYENAADAILAAGFSRSQPVQVTDEMVEKAAKAAHDHVRAQRPVSHGPYAAWGYLDDAYRDYLCDVERAALVAALGGGDHE